MEELNKFYSYNGADSGSQKSLQEMQTYIKENTQSGDSYWKCMSDSIADVIAQKSKPALPQFADPFTDLNGICDSNPVTDVEKNQLQQLVTYSQTLPNDDQKYYKLYYYLTQTIKPDKTHPFWKCFFAKLESKLTLI